MARLPYNGVAPATNSDVLNRGQARDVLNSGPINRTTVQGQINDYALTRAVKSYVDTQDALYVLPSYVATRDALNLPVASVGEPDGVAFLDAGTGTVPLSQMPAMGGGYLLGAYGPTEVFGITAGGSPTRLANFNIGATGQEFYPMVFGHVLAKSANLGRTVIEARISSGSDTYANSTLIAHGLGRTPYAEIQPVSLVPTQHLDPVSPSYNTWISLWAYDLSQSTVVSSDSAVAVGVYLLKTA